MRLTIRVLLAVFLCLNFLSASAATLTVNSTADNGTGSLRDTLAVAQPGDAIHFSPDLAGQTILLTSGELMVNGLTNVTIDASALPGGVVISANYASRVFNITNHAG